ncbi:hypothetical protein [Mycolicibacterium sp. J2]|jgi:hypothetical protein|nr:hypothetical protein [Mycolicibacterium sp. J2]MCX2716047.1 hypothetical protein [Mycolicibacterium sp. J2]
MITTFVRTPAQTVMLTHTDGYLTINRATPDRRDGQHAWRY